MIEEKQNNNGFHIVKCVHDPLLHDIYFDDLRIYGGVTYSDATEIIKQLIKENVDVAISTAAGKTKALYFDENGKTFPVKIIAYNPFEFEMTITVRSDEQIAVNSSRIVTGPEYARCGYLNHDYVWWRDRNGDSIPARVIKQKNRVQIEIDSTTIKWVSPSRLRLQEKDFFEF